MPHLESVLVQRRVDIMTTPNRRRIFDEESKYEELINLLESGNSYSRIAKHFGCDHTSVIYQAKRIKVIKDRISKGLPIELPKEPYVRPGHCKRCGSILALEKPGNGIICGWCIWDVNPTKKYNLYFLYEGLL